MRMSSFFLSLATKWQSQAGRNQPVQVKESSKVFRYKLVERRTTLLLFSFTDRHTFDAMPSALKLQWVLQNLSYNSAIVVTVSYWSYIAVLDRQGTVCFRTSIV